MSILIKRGILAATVLFAVTASTALPPAPANDLCADAVTIVGGSSTLGSTTTATIDGTAFCGTSNTAPGIWYHVDGTGNVFRARTDAPGTTFDTKLTVFSGGCGTLTCVDGDDDGGAGLQSRVDWFSAPGEEYLILVHGFGAATGDFELVLEEFPPAPNDDVCDALPVSVDSTTPFDNTLASAQAGEVNPGGGTGASSCNSQDGWCSFETDVDNSVWFTFEGPPSGCVNIIAPELDYQLALWQAETCFDFASFSEIAANDDSGDDIFPGAYIFAPGIIESCVVPGETYWIQLDGYAGAFGPGTLVIEDCGYEMGDIDCDDVINPDDNCTDVPNPSQDDADGDDLGDACDGIHFSTETSFFVPGPQHLFNTIGYSIEPLSSTIDILFAVLPSNTNLDALDTKDGDVLFSVRPATHVLIGGVLTQLKETVIYRFDGATISEELNPRDLDVRLQTLNALDCLGDGSYLISVDETRRVRHAGGRANMRPWQVWHMVPDGLGGATLHLAKDFGPLGFTDVNGVDMLDDGRIAVSNRDTRFVSLPGLNRIWKQNVYIYDPADDSLIESFDGSDFYLDDLDALVLADHEAPVPPACN